MKSIPRGSIYAVILVIPLMGSLPSVAQTPPAQPLTGPGGREYLAASIRASGPFHAAGHVGDDAFRYWTFEPANPAPATAPVVLFLHAFLVYDPAEYQFWIAHLVLKGHTVVWPQYDKTGLDTWNWANNAAEAFVDALARLDVPGRVRPARDSQNKYLTATVGHSAGGFMSAVIAAKATRWWWAKLPKPKAVLAFEPGSKNLIPDEDFSRIDPATKMLLVGGEDDAIVCLADVNKLWSRTAQIPDANRDFLLVQTDTHGSPQQIANHYFPNNTGRMDTALVDARDFYVTFKLSAAGLSCAFRNQDCAVAFGNGSIAQIDMGRWSDGTLLKQMAWSADPSGLRPACSVR